MEVIIGIGIFLTTVLLIEAAYSLTRTIRQSGSSRVRKRLRTLSAGGYTSHETDIVRKRVLSEVPWFNRFLLRIPRIHKLDQFLEQANVGFPIGVFILLSLFFAMLGSFGFSFLIQSRVGIMTAALLCGAIPFLFLSIRKKKRLAKFERQLPDALDLIARSLKAGHALSGGLKMVGDEFEDPIGTEFDKTLDQINFGIGMQEALINFSERIDSEDLRFFVISVIVQRETGGNLAEILQKISAIIRQRFELRGRIKVLSAEGRLSAIILTAVPFFIGFYFYLVRPSYIGTLFTDSIGHVMLVIVVFQMIIGIFSMKRIVSIKV